MLYFRNDNSINENDHAVFLHSKMICFTFIDGCMPWQSLECVDGLFHSIHPAHSDASIDSRVDRIALPVRQDSHHQALSPYLVLHGWQIKRLLLDPGFYLTRVCH